MNIENSKITKVLSRHTKISPALALPKKLNDNIQPVIEVVKRYTENFFQDDDISNESSTLLDGSNFPKQQFYITQIICENPGGGVGYLTAVIGGATTKLMILHSGESAVYDYPNPIPVDVETDIIATETANEGFSMRVCGYFLDIE